LIRGAAVLPDDVGDACKQYLDSLTPLADDVVATLLQVLKHPSKIYCDTLNIKMNTLEFAI
jgi:hypothetical protein